jgi:hypothetical protein
VTRQTVRLWRARSGFPEPLGRLGQSVVRDWEHVLKLLGETEKKVSEA